MFVFSAVFRYSAPICTKLTLVIGQLVDHQSEDSTVASFLPTSILVYIMTLIVPERILSTCQPFLRMLFNYGASIYLLQL